MSFWGIAGKIDYPDKTTERYKALDAYQRLLEGTFYDHIKVPFDREDDGSGYVPLRQRRPSVIWNGAELVVSQLGGLMWGDEQMPAVRTYVGNEPTEQDQAAEAAISHIIEELTLDDVMMQVTRAAATGSCAIIVRAMADKSLYIEIVDGKKITPTFDPQNPNVLQSIEQLYPILGADLAEYGYDIPEANLGRTYWYRLTIDGKSETRYKPMLDEQYMKLGKIENGRRISWEVEASYDHGFSTTPVIWAKAPGVGKSPLDGACLFGKVVDNLVEIDYLLSQIGRGYRYSADPMLAVSQGELVAGARPAGYGDEFPETAKDGNGRIIKSASNVLNLGTNGSAQLLEISGQGLAAAGEHVKLLREWTLEVMGGMKSDSETQKGAQSGRALELLYQALVLLVKRWRIALGNKAFLPLIRLILEALKTGQIEIPGLDVIPDSAVMRLVWPSWMTPTGGDLLATANAYQTLAGGSATAPVPILPRAFITKVAATNLGATDVASLADELDEQVEDDRNQQIEDEQRQATLAQSSKPQDG